MSRESSFSEISSIAAFVAFASAISASADSIFSCTSFFLTVRSSSDTVVTSVVPATASMLDVGPVKVKDVGGIVVKVVDEVERLFGVESDVICWFSEVRLVEVGPAKKLCNDMKTQIYLDFTLSLDSLSETLPESYDNNPFTAGYMLC